MLGPRAEIATRFTSQRPGMSPPLICELGINTFDRARCNSKQRLQPSLRQARQKTQAAVGSTQRGVRPERSDRADAWFDRAGSTSQHQHLLASPSLKLSGARIRNYITQKRAKALATNALDAGGQRQTHSTPSGAATQTHKQKGSLGD